MPTEDRIAKWEKLKAQADKRHETHEAKFQRPFTRMDALRGLVEKTDARLNQYSDHRKTSQETLSDLPESTNRLEHMERRLRRWTGKGAGLNLDAKGGSDGSLAPMGMLSGLGGMFTNVETLHEQTRARRPTADAGSREAAGEERTEAFTQEMTDFVKGFEPPSRETASEERQMAFKKEMDAFYQGRNQGRKSAKDQADDKAAHGSDDVESDADRIKLPGGFDVPDVSGLSGMLQDLHARTQARDKHRKNPKPKNQGRGKDKAEASGGKHRPGWQTLPGGQEAPGLGGLKGLLGMASELHKETQSRKPKTDPSIDKHPGFQDLSQEQKPSESDDRPNGVSDSGPKPIQPSKPHLIQKPPQPSHSQLSPHGSPRPPVPNKSPSMPNVLGIPNIGPGGTPHLPTGGVTKLLPPPPLPPTLPIPPMHGGPGTPMQGPGAIPGS